MSIRNHNMFRPSMPEQGGTGVACMPEQGGTGVRLAPEKGGTGLARAALALALAVGLSWSTVEAGDDLWHMSGELQGNAQITIDSHARLQMSFLLPDASDDLQFHVASGQMKGSHAWLDVYRVDMSGNGELLRTGSLELFLGACSADAELRLKSEADGSGGKSEADGSGGKSEADGSGEKGNADMTTISRVFTLAQSSTLCLSKSEADGSG
jgi:hypothetical protein